MDRLAITQTAFRSAQELGFRKIDIVETIKAIERNHFYKSMTSQIDHRIWQDVYHVPSEAAGELYVKFTAGEVTDFVVLSFKPREEA